MTNMQLIFIIFFAWAIAAMFLPKGSYERRLCGLMAMLCAAFGLWYSA